MERQQYASTSGICGELVAHPALANDSHELPPTQRQMQGVPAGDRTRTTVAWLRPGDQQQEQPVWGAAWLSYGQDQQEEQSKTGSWSASSPPPQPLRVDNAQCSMARCRRGALGGRGRGCRQRGHDGSGRRTFSLPAAMTVEPS